MAGRIISDRQWIVRDTVGDSQPRVADLGGLDAAVLVVSGVTADEPVPEGDERTWAEVLEAWDPREAPNTPENDGVEELFGVRVSLAGEDDIVPLGLEWDFGPGNGTVLDWSAGDEHGAVNVDPRPEAGSLTDQLDTDLQRHGLRLVGAVVRTDDDITLSDGAAAVTAD
jgi:hypothetical protein